MNIIIKIFVSILPVIVIIISLFVIARSGISIGKIWQQGVDLKSSVQKFCENLTGKMDLIVLKNKMALYKNGDNIAFTRYEPTIVDDGILFPTVFVQGEANELKDLKNGDTVEFRYEKYEIISAGTISGG